MKQNELQTFAEKASRMHNMDCEKRADNGYG